MDLRHQVEIDRPPEAVWPWIEEPERQKQWMKGLLSNELVSGNQSEVGARFRMRIKEGGRIAEYDGEVVASDRPRHLAVRITGGPFKDGGMNVDYRLVDLGGRTRIDYVCSAQCGGWLVKALGWLFRGFARMQIKSFFKTLKQLAEQGEPVGAR